MKTTSDLTRKAAGMELKQYAAEHIIENGKHYPEKWVNRYFIELADAQRALDAERERVAKLEKIQAIDLKNNNEYRQQLATLQAQLAACQVENSRLIGMAAQQALADTGVKNQDLIRIVCAWQFDDDDTDMAETECGHAFTFEDPDRAADWMKFCCYCGKPVELLRPEDIDEVNK